ISAGKPAKRPVFPLTTSPTRRGCTLPASGEEADGTARMLWEGHADDGDAHVAAASRQRWQRYRLHRHTAVERRSSEKNRKTSDGPSDGSRDLHLRRRN